MSKELIENSQLEELLRAMQDSLAKRMLTLGVEDPIMVGLHSGGVWLAERLHADMELVAPLGKLNIGFHRDDFSQRGLHGQIKPSEMPLSVENRHIILVDDVLYTGRSARAAMNELFDYGRPASITLAVLVDRDGHELPIEAQIAGMKLTLSPDDYVELSGPHPLSLSIVKA